MIVRYYIACRTCGKKYITRIQVGYATQQEHSFHCYQCKELIRFALDRRNLGMPQDFQLVDNCVKTEEEDGTPIYFSPDFATDKELINKEVAFPSFVYMHQLFSSGYGKNIKQNHATPQTLISFQQSWGPLQKSWRLHNAGQYQLAQQIISEFAIQHGLTEKTLRENLWYFVNLLFHMPQEIGSELKSVTRTYSHQFERFLHYYQQNLRENHRRSQYDILSEYFDAYSQHAQVLTYARANLPLNQSAMVTSVDFDKVKDFYAKGYEFFAGAICIYTCLNNIKEGRPFDQLKSISLLQYLKTDKAKRRDSIAGNKVFSGATSEFDSQVRNASYHNWMFMRPDNYTIEYRPGGAGATQTMTYTQYLYRCALMVKQVCNLFSLELILDEIANQMGY